jgi:hypothetical protein
MQAFSFLQAELARSFLERISSNFLSPPNSNLEYAEEGIKIFHAWLSGKPAAPARSRRLLASEPITYVSR